MNKNIISKISFLILIYTSMFGRTSTLDYLRAYNPGDLKIAQNESVQMGELRLTMQSDGNLVLQQGNSVLWNTKTAGQNCESQNCHAIFQTDGNFVVYNGENPIWNSKTGGYSHTQLFISQKSPYIFVDYASPFLCDALSVYNSTGIDSSAVLQNCINQTSNNQNLLLPSGVYTIEKEIIVNHPMTLATIGKIGQPPCSVFQDDHRCAVLKASNNTFVSLGFIKVRSDSVNMDHLILNGNRISRQSSFAAAKCRSGDNSFGMNISFTGNNLNITNSGFTYAVCGTGFLVTSGSNINITSNIIAFNGIHNQSGLFSDGLTAHELKNSTIASNYFVDNTDVDLIFGACENCKIQSNTVFHSNSFNSSAFAAIMIQAWPNGGTTGNYNGTDISRNVIQCSAGHRCGIGIYLGSSAWYNAPSFGGNVHDNSIVGAQLGFAVDKVTGFSISNNNVSGSGGTFETSCGKKNLSAYVITPGTMVDRSKDPIPNFHYLSYSLDGCIPNWWNKPY